MSLEKPNIVSSDAKKIVDIRNPRSEARTQRASFRDEPVEAGEEKVKPSLAADPAVPVRAVEPCSRSSRSPTT